MYLEITNDIHLGLKFGCCNAENRKIPEWTIINNSAGIPPLSPVKSEGDPEIITLVPYGCARLRITEFPIMDVVLMEDLTIPGR